VAEKDYAQLSVDWSAVLCAGIGKFLSHSHQSGKLLHNFTLIHDDIEDQSDTRHRLPTLWKKWGLPLSLNAGDFVIRNCVSIDIGCSDF
jgi:hypothetical protein